jgi:TPR repeat protein
MKTRRANESKPEVAFTRASQYWDAGDVTRALRVFKSLALDGDTAAQLNLGYFFDRGIGVRRSETKALFWYRRTESENKEAQRLLKRIRLKKSTR